MILPVDFYRRPTLEVARELIGKVLVYKTTQGVTAGAIVEVEAYGGLTDPASHAWRGRTPRTEVMFGPPGRLYVYFSYGMHWCLNLVCEPGSAVLIRALEPRHGLSAMAERRGLTPPRLLCAGPGRLCQALGVTAALDGLSLEEPPFRLFAACGAPDWIADRRIGISRAVETPSRAAT